MMASRDGWPKRDIDNYYVGKPADEMESGQMDTLSAIPASAYINGDFYGTGALANRQKKKL